MLGVLERFPMGPYVLWYLGIWAKAGSYPDVLLIPPSHGSGVPIALLPRPSMNSQRRKGGKTISDVWPAPRPSWLRATRFPRLPCDPAPAGPTPAALGRPGEKGKERCNPGKRSLKNSRVKGGKLPHFPAGSSQELAGYLQVLLTSWLAGTAVQGRGMLLPSLSCFIL